MVTWVTRTSKLSRNIRCVARGRVRQFSLSRRLRHPSSPACRHHLSTTSRARDRRTAGRPEGRTDAPARRRGVERQPCRSAELGCDAAPKPASAEAQPLPHLVQVSRLVRGAGGARHRGTDRLSRDAVRPAGRHRLRASAVAILRAAAEREAPIGGQRLAAAGDRLLPRHARHPRPHRCSRRFVEARRRPVDLPGPPAARSVESTRCAADVRRARVARGHARGCPADPDAVHDRACAAPHRAWRTAHHARHELVCAEGRRWPAGPARPQVHVPATGRFSAARGASRARSRRGRCTV